MKLDKETIDEIARLSPIEMMSDALFLHTRDYDKHIAESSVMVWAQLKQDTPAYVPSIVGNKKLRIRTLARMMVLIAALIRKELIDKDYKGMFGNEIADAQKELYLVAQDFGQKDYGDCEPKDDAEG